MTTTSVEPPSSVLSKSKDRAAHKERIEAGESRDLKVLKHGLFYSSIWGLGASGLSFYLHKTSNWYRKKQPALKVFWPILVFTGSFFVVADWEQVEQDRLFTSKYSIHDIKEKSKSDDWIHNNRYMLMGSLWATVMGASLAYNWANPRIPRAQKIINSRMVAQSAVLLGLVGFAAVSSLVDPKDKGEKI